MGLAIRQSYPQGDGLMFLMFYMFLCSPRENGYLSLKINNLKKRKARNSIEKARNSIEKARNSIEKARNSIKQRNRSGEKARKFILDNSPLKREICL
jgi:hypothetical protein